MREEVSNDHVSSESLLVLWTNVKPCLTGRLVSLVPLSSICLVQYVCICSQQCV